MIAIQVKRCVACGTLEDVHTFSAADGTTTIELSCGCGKGETRVVKVKKDESYWLEIPVVQHTHEAAKESEPDGNDQNTGEGSI